VLSPIVLSLFLIPADGLFVVMGGVYWSVIILGFFSPAVLALVLAQFWVSAREKGVKQALEDYELRLQWSDPRQEKKQ
jgi:hypothetical protein